MDVLSEVLRAVKLDGAVFFNGEFSSPWCAREPDACTVASYLPAHPRHVIIFHLVTEGRGYVRIEGDGRAVPLAAGDIVILPQGKAHFMDLSVRRRRRSHQVDLWLPDLRPSALRSFLGRASPDRQSPYPGQPVRTVVGRQPSLFCGPCGSIWTGRRRRHRQIIRGIIRGNVAAVHRKLADVANRLAGRCAGSRRRKGVSTLAQATSTPLDNRFAGE